MLMRTHLQDTFRFNEQANLALLPKIAQLEDRAECIKLFSHLIRCQIKWMARLQDDARAQRLDWWKPELPFEELEPQWRASVAVWQSWLEGRSEEELAREVSFVGYDGARWAAAPQDIALQLNYHAIHHRAQMQSLLRRAGVAPDFVDYIRTRYRRLG